MGSFLNQLTQPLGIKLFHGGPYPDAGVGDQMGAKAKEQEANAAKYMEQLAPIIAQIAQSAGVANPLEKGSVGQFDQNPYGLSNLQQAELNKNSGIDSQAYDQIMSRVKANLSARGLGNSGAMTAAEAYLQKQLQSQLGQERVAAGENAYQNRQGAQQQIAGLLGQGYGAQQQAGANTMNVLDTQRQAALQAHNQAMQNLGQALALGMYSGGVGIGGNNGNGGGSKSGSTSQPNYMGVFGGGGGANPMQGQIEGQSQQFYQNPLQHVNWGNIYTGARV